MTVQPKEGTIQIHVAGAHPLQHVSKDLPGAQQQEHASQLKLQGRGFGLRAIASVKKQQIATCVQQRMVHIQIAVAGAHQQTDATWEAALGLASILHAQVGRELVNGHGNLMIALH
jgi:hypothetical protein